MGRAIGALEEAILLQIFAKESQDPRTKVIWGFSTRSSAQRHLSNGRRARELAQIEDP